MVLLNHAHLPGRRECKAVGFGHVDFETDEVTGRSPVN